MRGLLKNNFYGAFGNIKLFLAFDALLSIVLFASGSPSLLNVLAIITAPAIALLAVSCLRKESASKWGQYKLTFPVTRKTIVRSQFVSHLLWTLLGVFMVGVMIALTVLIHGNNYFAYGIRDAFTLVFCGGVIAALLGAIAYPMLYLWGAERTEAVLAISIVASVGIVMGLTWLINMLIGAGTVSDNEYYMSMAMIFVIATVLYIGSYYLTTTIFKRKEY